MLRRLTMKILTRVLWIIAGILLIIAGIFCLMSPATAIAGMSLYLGIAMLFSGIVDLVIFASASGQMAGAGWFLADGIITILLSLFILGDQWFTALTLPFIFGMWLIFSGISAFSNSFELRRLGVRGWGWFTALGVILAVVGFFSFMDPFASVIAMTVTVGVFLVLQGIVSILRGCFSHRFWL